MRDWFSRNWLILGISAFLIFSILILIRMMNEPAFQTFSTILSILIGGLSTTLFQLVSQSRERFLKIEDEKRQLVRQVIARREESLRSLFDKLAIGAMETIAHVQLSLLAHEEGEKEKFELEREKLYEKIADYKWGIDAVGIATINASKSDVLKKAYENMGNEAMKVAEMDLQSLTAKEFSENKKPIQDVMLDTLGEVYAELDRLFTMTKLP